MGNMISRCFKEDRLKGRLTGPARQLSSAGPTWGRTKEIKRNRFLRPVFFTSPMNQLNVKLSMKQQLVEK